MMSGWAKVVLGNAEAGLAELRDGLDRWRSIGSKIWGTIRFARVAAAFIEVGQAEQGAALLNEAFQVMDSNGEHWYEAELRRLQGEILAASPSSRMGEAEACFEHAARVACSQGARLFELRSAMALSRLRCDRQQRLRRSTLLRSIYESFTEGLDTPDLKEAKARLSELA
jgi:predicted ATPase